MTRDALLLPKRLTVALSTLAAIATAGSPRIATAAEASAWASDLAESSESLLGDDLLVDPQFQLAQAAQEAPAERPPANRTVSRARTSRVPFMIGDQSIGLSGGLTVEGLDVSSFEHPIFGGNRFNVAENNTTIPVDRLSLNYRHFHNAYDTYALGQSRSTSVERFDLGFEKTAFDGMASVQVVLPLLRQLDSDLDVFDDGVGGSNLPITDRHGEIGNLAVNFKVLLTTRENYAITGGLAVNTPTAEDAYFTQNFDDPDIIVLSSPFVSTVTPTNISITSRFDNDTVNLTPYLAWHVRPTSAFFHQGFFQVDAPLNRSDASIDVTGFVTPDSNFSASALNASETGEIDQQTLLRLNLGFGYWLHRGDESSTLRGLAGLVEVHYTSTLDEANPFVVPAGRLLSTTPAIDDIPIDIAAGPLNDIDQVNLSMGLAAYVGALQITNGFVVPVSENDDDRAFDFEYSLQVNRRY